jgi:tetratricopeptide (TPR) repeat protein
LRAVLVDALANVGYWKEADTDCRHALESHPDNCAAPLDLAASLWQHGREEEAVVMYHKAIESDRRIAFAHHSLGVLCWRMCRHEEAVTAFRAVKQLTPGNAAARQALGHELAAAGHPAEAITEFQAALALKPTPVSVYLELGQVLWAQGRPEAAAAAFQQGTTLDPRQAWDGMAAARLDQGRFAEARAATERLLALPANEAVRRAQRRQIDLCNALLAVDADLPAILAGKKRPADAATGWALAEWCLKHKRLTATAAGFYTAAFSAQPSLADDLEAGHRFRAACAAALAGGGVGADAGMLDDRQRAELRRQAHDWLTAEYGAWAERHRQGKPGDRTVAATAVRSWLTSEDLAPVRDEKALAGLPADERRDWQALWSKAEALVARDPVELFEHARAHAGRREWGKAAASYAEGFDLGPTDDGKLWFEYAACQLLAGDRPGYRRTCAHMLARGQTTPLMRPYLAARACTLAPDSADDPELPGRLALGELQGNKSAFWSLTEQAALHVRAGRVQEATPLLERSLTADGKPARAMLNWLWLALAHQKLGKAAEARRWRDRAANWLDQQGDQMPRESARMGSHLHNWLEAQVLRQEADALLR